MTPQPLVWQTDAGSWADVFFGEKEVRYALLHGDCFDNMREIPDQSIDMVLCDLPYGTTKCAWDSVLPLDVLWGHYRRVCRPGAVVVLTASQPFTSVLGASNVAWLKYAWIWRKNNATGHLNARKMPMKDYEDVLVFCGGTPKYHPQGLVPCAKVVRRGGNGACYGKSGTENVQNFTGYPRMVLDVAYDTPRVHPTQKPVTLLEYFIRTYSDEHDVVLDNTMGSGSTGVACLRSNRRFVGIELNEAYYSVAQRRMEVCE